MIWGFQVLHMGSIFTKSFHLESIQQASSPLAVHTT